MDHPYHRKYFEDGEPGYYRYTDFPVNYKKVEKILAMNPESVLEIGCAKGYIVKKLNDAGVSAWGMDISEYCHATRAHDNLVCHDMTVLPWPFRDKQFDLVFNCAVLEHIPEDKIDAVISEIHRVSKRSLNAISFDNIPDDKDTTHCNLRPKSYWMKKFNTMVTSFAQSRDTVIDKEEFEEKQCNVPAQDGLVKVNAGSHRVMYHYGWINTDILPLNAFAEANGYTFLQQDHENMRFYLFKRKVLDIILMSHVLEHFDREHGKRIIEDAHRVLKDGGIIRIAVPDTRYICNDYLEGNVKRYGTYNIGVEKAADDADALYKMLMEGHKTLYDAKSLVKLLQESGFTDVRQMKFGQSRSPAIRRQTVDMYPESTLYVEATNKIDTLRWDTRKLKIAIISPPLITTPPSHYGGLEAVNADLGEMLAKMGHDVTIIGAKGSRVTGCKIVETIEPANKVQVDWLQYEKQHYEQYKHMLGDFDIIEDSTWYGWPYIYKMEHPDMKLCHRVHGHMNWQSNPVAKMNLIAISKSIREELLMHTPPLGWPSEVCYNGINMNLYRPGNDNRDGLVFVGRIDRIKGPHAAIDVARRTGQKLTLIGGTFVNDVGYVDTIRKMCDGTQIKLIENATHEQKVEALQHARALVHCSNFQEPFGLDLVEAMACGTPVITMRDGACAEVVQHGITGFVCNSIDEMVDSWKKIDAISPRACIDRVAINFTRGKMAETTLEIYKDILSGIEW